MDDALVLPGGELCRRHQGLALGWHTLPCTVWIWLVSVPAKVTVSYFTPATAEERALGFSLGLCFVLLVLVWQGRTRGWQEQSLLAVGGCQPEGQSEYTLSSFYFNFYVWAVLN